ncbi:Major facilitator superfamily domain general substrate transporter [Penicillium expansum]|nr:Major facilitator superfamily domain general substrate transporter [Penicillium expansum]
MERRRPSCSDSLSRSEAQIRLCPEKFDESSTDDGQKLPPVDGGFHAWMFLAACTMLEALIWGFAFAFGVFQKYYHDHEAFQDSGMVAVIGTCATGISYLSCPLIIVAMILLPQWGRWFSSVGLIMMCLSLALGSFSTNITHLVLSQGVGFGIGGCIAYSPSIMYMDEWFVHRRGLAFGITWAGSGVSGIIFPIGLEKLLNRFGFETTLRVISVVVFVLAAPFIYFHRPRLPVRKTVDYQRLNFRFLTTRIFCFYQLGNIIEALGFFLPGIYLPTYARSIGASDFLSSLTVTLLNLASVFGSVTMGHLADRYHAITCITISTVGSTLAVFFLWGFSTSLPTLFVFSIAYGLFAGCYSATWSGITHEVRRVDPSADATIIFGVIAFGRGIGNVVSGPLSEAILGVDSWKGSAAAGYGSGYGLIILCTGLSCLLSGASVVAHLC